VLIELDPEQIRSTITTTQDQGNTDSASNPDTVLPSTPLGFKISEDQSISIKIADFGVGKSITLV
jgi:hypothetical protein